jgi:hypothetical protein
VTATTFSIFCLCFSSLILSWRVGMLRRQVDRDRRLVNAALLAHLRLHMHRRGDFGN